MSTENSKTTALKIGGIEFLILLVIGVVILSTLVFFNVIKIPFFNTTSPKQIKSSSNSLIQEPIMSGKIVLTSGEKLKVQKTAYQLINSTQLKAVLDSPAAIFLYFRIKGAIVSITKDSITIENNGSQFMLIPDINTSQLISVATLSAQRVQNLDLNSLKKGQVIRASIQVSDGNILRIISIATDN